MGYILWILHISPYNRFPFEGLYGLWFLSRLEHAVTELSHRPVTPGVHHTLHGHHDHVVSANRNLQWERWYWFYVVSVFLFRGFVVYWRWGKEGLIPKKVKCIGRTPCESPLTPCNLQRVPVAYGLLNRQPEKSFDLGLNTHDLSYPYNLYLIYPYNFFLIISNFFSLSI